MSAAGDVKHREIVGTMPTWYRARRVHQRGYRFRRKSALTRAARIVTVIAFAIGTCRTARSAAPSITAGASPP